MDIALLGAVLAACVLCLLEKEGANLMPPGIFTKPARLSAGRFVVFFILLKESAVHPGRSLPDARIWWRCLWSNCC